MNLQRLQKQLEIDESKKLEVYLDPLGHRVVGVGHLIVEDDPEEIRALQVGHRITEEKCKELFQRDLAIAITDCKIIFDDWESFPAVVQEVLVNIIFNLKRSRFLGLKKTIEAIYNRDWKTASREIADSKWARQVGARASRLVSRLEHT